jgi:GrpB-like predicted nucleotidyltransferase (UPF0157 family)
MDADPEDDVELLGGVEKREIVIVDPDPGLGAEVRRRASRIVHALGTRARRVDHIGSTAVPGLPAKPIIDINLSVDDVDDEAAYLPQLLAAGYQLRVRQRGHRMVRTPTKDVHVHVCTLGSTWEQRDLLFRDWLRTHPADRDRYATLKRQLAQQDWPDMNAYADAKGPFITEVTRHPTSQKQSRSAMSRSH